MQDCFLRVPEEKSAQSRMMGFFVACAVLNMGTGAFSGRVFHWFPAKQGAIVGTIQAPFLTAALLSLKRLFDDFRKVEKLTERFGNIQEVNLQELQIDAFEALDREDFQRQLYNKVAVKTLPKTFVWGVLGFIAPLITKACGFDLSFKQLKLYYRISFMTLFPLRYFLVWGVEKAGRKNRESG